jgi:cytochrome c-type biogenesis protein CcmE
MTPRRKKVTLIIIGGVVGLGLAVGLVLYALKNNVSLYFTPTQVFNKEAPQGRSFRIGGLVEAGSVKREGDGLTVHFNVTDTVKTMDANNVFIAEEVLAKHDENYMPPEAKDALDKAAKAKAGAAASAGASSPSISY